MAAPRRSELRATALSNCLVACPSWKVSIVSKAFIQPFFVETAHHNDPLSAVATRQSVNVNKSIVSAGIMVREGLRKEASEGGEGERDGDESGEDNVFLSVGRPRKRPPSASATQS